MPIPEFAENLDRLAYVERHFHVFFGSAMSAHEKRTGEDDHVKNPRRQDLGRVPLSPFVFSHAVSWSSPS